MRWVINYTTADRLQASDVQEMHLHPPPYIKRALEVPMSSYRMNDILEQVVFEPVPVRTYVLTHADIKTRQCFYVEEIK